MALIALCDQVDSTDGGVVCCGVPAEPITLLSAAKREAAWRCGCCQRVITHEHKTARVTGGLLVQLLDPQTMRVLDERRDNNVFTDIGRNYLASLVSYATFLAAPGSDEPAGSKRRYDGIRYVAMGTGSQLETNTVSRLHTPVVFNSNGDYLAQVVAPNELPGSGVSAAFTRIFGLNELSVSGPVVVTEAGLFASGPAIAPLLPSNGNAPPVAYKVFEPLTKTTNVLLSVRWEIRF